MPSNDQWLRDVEELKQLKYQYGALVDRCCDERDGAARQLLDLVTEDFVGDFTQIFGKVFNNPQEFREFFATTLPDRRAWVWHSFTNPIIQVEGDRAKAIWLLYAQSTPREEPNAQPVVTYGRYFDEFVRTSKGWRQSRLLFKNETRKPA